MRNKLAKLRKKAAQPLPMPQSAEVADTDLSAIPRITNETVAEHREEVLKGARKYIYPLQHSKHRIVLITGVLVTAAIVAFLSYCIVGLYKFHHNNEFLYRVTQVIPFPIARTGHNFISYENYLFELRHYEHYYVTQQQSDLKDERYKQQLQEFRKTALQQVIDDSYIKTIAKQKGVSVSSKELNNRIELVKAQNRLGNNNKVFEDVLRDYWGWSIRDFQRSLRQQILAEKVVAALDSTTTIRAQDALNQLKTGANFSDLAKAISDDPAAKTNGGEYGFKIDKANRDIPPQVVEALFSLKPGQVSGIVNTGSTLEIVKLNGVEGDRVTGSHIVFKLKDISNYVNDLKVKQKAKSYVTF